MTATKTLTLRETWETLATYRRDPIAHGYPENLHHLFAPIDQVHAAFVALCTAATVSLAAGLYGWDDDEIDQLFREKLDDEKIPVTLALDKSQAGGVHERKILAKWRPEMIGNSLVIGHSSRGAISHDKMIVIDGLVTIAGSTNLSASGESKQNNEAVIVWDPVFSAEARARIDMIHNEMLTQMQAARAA